MSNSVFKIFSEGLIGSERMRLFGLKIADWVSVFVIITFFLLWIQVVISHYKGGFRRFPMLEPVVLAPLLIAFGLLSFFFSALSVIYQILLWFGFAVGLSGVYFHFDGIRKRAKDFSFQGLINGPPLPLPLIFALLSLLGLLNFYL
jgi:hypothetical protein